MRITWDVGLDTDLSRKDLLPVLEPFLPSSWWAGCEGSVMSVCKWLLFPAPGCLHPAGLVAFKLVSDSCSDPKCCEGYMELHLPTGSGEGVGLFSLLFWPSCSFPEEKWQFLLDCDPPMVSPHVWPSGASWQTILRTRRHDSNRIFIR